MTQRSPADQHRRASNAQASYRERLTVSWWIWPIGLATAALMVAELGLTATVLRAWYAYLVAFVMVGAALLWLGRIQVLVVDDELWVDDARLPLRVVDAVTTIDGAARRDLLGVEADPMAFVIQRPWIPGGVRVDLADPTDPTPYWYVSSRRPERLAQALRELGISPR